MRKPTLLVCGAAAAALAVAGCGGGGSSSSSSASSTPAPASTPAAATSTPAQTTAGGGGQALKISADAGGALKFNTKTLSAKAGKVTITMANPSQLPHGVAVEGNGVDKDGKVVQNGGNSTVTVTLKPGKYTFYCPVPGHRQAGMQGTLTVK
jgi:plastocyanin